MHYFWVGNNVSRTFIENIITFKSENIGFEVNLWVNNKSLILNTFRSMTENCGEVFGCEFDKFRRITSKYNEEYMGKLNPNAFFIREMVMY
ncbi:hypothetical protein [Xenorhabdus lircayensis]|uniref:hypothetical protein n=1 Tax=Xenorhabdus lircayensis TaxID=2763499 RepID=UPI0038CD244D